MDLYPKGRGWSTDVCVLPVYARTPRVCVCECVCMFVLPVRVCVRVSEGGGFVCFVSICRRRWEEVVDAGLIPASQSKLQSRTSFSAPPSSRFQRRRTPPLTDLNTFKHTHTNTHTQPSPLCWVSPGEGSFFSTCVAQCLYVYFLKLLAHLDPSYPSFFHLCSPASSPPLSPLFGCYVSSLFPGLFI